MRFLIELSFKGTNYHGWQKQSNANTVQSEIDTALSVICQVPIEVTGAGRTDAGVHANQMYAHFDNNFDLDLKELKFKLNSILPNDILVINIFKVQDDFHSRFDATSRTYKYYIQSTKNVFNDNLYYFSRKLDVDAMNKASSYLLGVQDFTSFSKLHTQTHTNFCNITYANWEYHNELLVFTISANRFLRNMVRAIVGTLINIGLSKIKPIEIKEIISSKDRGNAGYSVPSHALFLTKILYDKEFK